MSEHAPALSEDCRALVYDVWHVQLHGLPKFTLCILTEDLSLQAIGGDETNTVGLDGLSERCAKYYKQGNILSATTYFSKHWPAITVQAPCTCLHCNCLADLQALGLLSGGLY